MSCIYSYLVSLLVYASAGLSSRLKGQVVDAALSVPTLEVVIVAPSRNPTNELAGTRSSRFDLLGKNASIIASLPCLWQGKQNCPGCTDSGCSRDDSSYKAIQQTGYEPVERIDFVGKEREHRRAAAVLMAKEETTLSATTQDVVEVALHASPSNKLGINQSN
jgi:hypothetical protein